MFKKLKDKIAEEVKISPLKLQTSVQQLAQAMVSPSSSINSTQETASNDNFSIAEESEVSETPRNSPDKENSTFHRVDLHEDMAVTPPRYPVAPRSRRSSASSMMSDASSLFPLYESPSNAYNFQSDLESTSEIDEFGGSTSHLQGISKEQLLTAYRKTQSRYHKYKGRYVDLARHFRELERQNGKIKVVLTETQDRALRKIAELKEQCMLEQKAKAHLEEALRNDLEEKDHLINALETKVKLLKGVDASEKCGLSQIGILERPLIHLENNSTSESQNSSISALQEKIVSLENQLLQQQRSLKEQLEELQQSKCDKEKANSALVAQEAENKKLKKELETQRKREEEAALSLAENKMQVHRELEAREEESKNLKALVAQLQEDLRILNRRKAIGNGEPIAASSESISSSVFEEAVSGEDSLPSQPASELNQLKDVLRRKYKEVESLVEENGHLRASLIMANFENGSIEKKISYSESFIQPELENINSDTKKKVRSNEETDLVEIHGSEELQLKNSTSPVVPIVTNVMNQKSVNLLLGSQTLSEAEMERQLLNAKDELEKVTTKWECKYNQLKEELSKLLSEKTEVLKLFSTLEVPLEIIDGTDVSLKNEENLLKSTHSLLKERIRWKKEEDKMTMRLRDLDNECGIIKGMLEKAENEKYQLKADLEKSTDEVTLLKNEAKDLKELTNRLTNERETLKDQIQEVDVKFKKLKIEAEDLQVSLKNMKSELSAKLSASSSALQEKESELQLAKAELKEAISSGVNKANKIEQELLDKCHQLEKELTEEKEARLHLQQAISSGENKASKMEQELLDKCHQLEKELTEEKEARLHLQQAISSGENKASKMEQELLDKCHQLEKELTEEKEARLHLQQAISSGENKASKMEQELLDKCHQLEKELTEEKEARLHLQQAISSGENKASKMEQELLDKCHQLEKELTEEKEARLHLQQAISSGENKASKMEQELLDKCHRLEKELTEEKEARSHLQQCIKSLQMEISHDFLSALSDGKSLLHESFEHMKILEKEKDILKAECEALLLRNKDSNKAISELRQLYEKLVIESEDYRQQTQKEIVNLIRAREEIKKLQVEAKSKAISALSELDAMMLKKQEAENRANKVQNELKAMRELEEKAKVEAEEAVHEQAAMRRSWEMQRDQIESMSREIEELKKAEDGLIRVLKEVREEVKNKDNEIASLVEESMKERSVSLINEEKMKNEVCGLKKLIEQHTTVEEQIKKEMEKVREASNEWKIKSDIHEKELDVIRDERKVLQRKLDEQENSQLKSIDAIKRLTDELSASVESKRRLQLELEAALEEVKTTKNLLDENQRKVEILGNKNEELSTLERGLKEKLEIVENEKSILMSQKNEMEEVLSHTKEERDQCKCQAEKLLKELENLEIELDELKKDKEKLENERENEKVAEVTNRKILEEQVLEISRREEELLEELEKYRTQDSNLVDKAKDEESPGKKRDKVLETEGGEELIRKLEEERDEVVKNLEEARGNIRTLEEKILYLENMFEAEKEKHVYAVELLKEELNARNESQVSENKGDPEEELKRLNEVKGELEENLAEVRKQAEKKIELDAKVNEMENLIKDMEKEFDSALASKEDDYQEQLSSYSERMEQEVAYARRELMEEIKGLREQLIAKRDAYDQLLEKHNSEANESKVEIDTVRRKLTDQLNKAVKSETSKWMDHISELETSHRKTLEDLQRKWDAERKSLEETSRVAVAAVESGTGSMSFLKQQLQAQAKELSETKRKYNSEILELRHLLSLGRKGARDFEKSSLEDATELEYLKNILYEYMMGKEPMVLARVIAAVVKFDDEQTKKVLTKEEQKQTLLGQFGLT